MSGGGLEFLPANAGPRKARPMSFSRGHANSKSLPYSMIWGSAAKITHFHKIGQATLTSLPGANLGSGGCPKGARHGRCASKRPWKDFFNSQPGLTARHSSGRRDCPAPVRSCRTSTFAKSLPRSPVGRVPRRRSRVSLAILRACAGRASGARRNAALESRKASSGSKREAPCPTADGVNRPACRRSRTCGCANTCARSLIGPTGTPSGSSRRTQASTVRWRTTSASSGTSTSRLRTRSVFFAKRGSRDSVLPATSQNFAN